MAYYPSWVSLDPEAVDFTLYDWIDYAFAIPTADFGLEWSDPGDEEKLKKIVEKAHKGETKVKISLGGWEGSQSVFCFLISIIQLNTEGSGISLQP